VIKNCSRCAALITTSSAQAQTCANALTDAL